MNYEEFVATLELDHCPETFSPCLRALWLDATGDWTGAHEIVQQMDDRNAARIHAYLHRKEGDDWNARYWHRRSGTVFPQHQSLEDEWASLVASLLSEQR